MKLQRHATGSEAFGGVRSGALQRIRLSDTINRCPLEFRVGPSCQAPAANWACHRSFIGRGRVRLRYPRRGEVVPRQRCPKAIAASGVREDGPLMRGERRYWPLRIGSGSTGADVSATPRRLQMAFMQSACFVLRGPKEQLMEALVIGTLATLEAQRFHDFE